MKSSLQLSKEAVTYQFNGSIPVRLYLKTCVTLLEEAQNSFQKGNVEKAFLMYVRYVDLCTNKLPTHPEIRSTQPDAQFGLVRQEYNQLIKLEVPAILSIIEDLKKKIDLDHQMHTQSLAAYISKAAPGSSSSKLENKIKLPANFDEVRFRQSVIAIRTAPNENLVIQEKGDGSLLYPELPQLTPPFPAFL
ncbi:LAMI_0G17370g1_1 [Lachancea mirantina]|uniref:Regulator of free ubiquitin chains 1 n=1 Tax=Lachancea mirantina TaxID=1230905 RepID=A0A1G4KD67_9SACH|nr:LAMI_0G17370g1_1 [Lachancea mirantina]